LTIERAAGSALAGVRRLSPWARHAIQILVDALAWFSAMTAAVLFRYESDLDDLNWATFVVIVGLATVGQTAIGLMMHLYRGRHPYGSFAEVRTLLVTVVLTTAIVGVPVGIWAAEFGFARGTYFLAAPIAFVVMGGARYIKRLLAERTVRPNPDAQRALVYGAGYLGRSVVRRMRTDRNSPFVPMGILDDSSSRRNTRVDDVRVLGTGDDLPFVARETGATVIVVAIAAADAVLLGRINDLAREAGVQVKVFPPLDEILSGRAGLRDLRNISIEDLVGRHPIDTDVAAVAGYLAGRRVLVTGAGGSIGSEISRQIQRLGPAALVLLDHDETALQQTQLSIQGHGLLDDHRLVLCSIRDTEALATAFERHRPEVVFHAAALKHLPVLERLPREAWLTNVLGTLNVLSAARSVDVDVFVNVSTDKAAEPTSVLGKSKLLAERLTAWAAQDAGKRFLSVRFGNVLGSRGSLVPVLAAQIQAGGPLTVTHPDATRYFMTIPEASQLVIHAGAIGKPGEVLVLDMGEPVRILDIARRMIELSGDSIEIVFTGLRDGEKLHETLVGAEESVDRPIHPKISHAAGSPLPPAALEPDGWRQWRRAHGNGS